MGQKTITRAVVGIPPTVGVYAKMEKRTVLLTGAAGRVGTLLRQHWGARYHLRLTDVCPISDLAEHEEYYPSKKRRRKARDRLKVEENASDFLTKETSDEGSSEPDYVP